MPEMQTLPYDGPKIRDLRERAGLSLTELAKRVRRHPGSLRNIENTRKNASRVTLCRIANELGVELEDITLEADPPGQPLPTRLAS